MKTQVLKGLFLMSALAAFQGCGGLTEAQKQEFFAVQRATQDVARGLEAGALDLSLSGKPSDDQIKISNRARELIAEAPDSEATPKKCTVAPQSSNGYSILGEDCPAILQLNVAQSQTDLLQVLGTVEYGFLLRDDQMKLVSDVHKLDLAANVAISYKEDSITGEFTSKIQGQGSIESKSRGAIPVTIEGELNDDEFRVVYKYKLAKFTAELEISQKIKGKSTSQANTGTMPMTVPGRVAPMTFKLNGEPLSIEKIRSYMGGDEIDTRLSEILRRGSAN